MTNNTLAFIALSNEYCSAIENSAEATDARAFVGQMLSLLARIYICARDLEPDSAADEGYIESYLEEETYNRLRDTICRLLGEHDTFLETFESDMKYSDTPIAASASEGLCDIFQVLFNFVETVREAPDELVESAVSAVRDDFQYNWSMTLCNILRPLNSIYYNELA